MASRWRSMAAGSPDNSLTLQWRCDKVLQRHHFLLLYKNPILDELTVIPGFIMTAEGHLLFSIACAVFAKNVELTPVLAQGDWWHIVPAAVLTCLLPDIDHPKSFLGQRIPWVS